MDGTAYEFLKLYVIRFCHYILGPDITNILVLQNVSYATHMGSTQDVALNILVILYIIKHN
jgi:hypothetical protein